MGQKETINCENRNTMQATSPAMDFNVRDLLHIARKRWYYYVVALIFCIVGAYIGIHCTAPMYLRVATVLIKDKNDGSRTLSEAQLFKEVGLANIASNVENEILIFKSLHLAEMVVRQLHLDVRYQKETFWRPVDLYGVNPVTVEFTNGDDLACQFCIQLLSGKKITIKDLRYKGELLNFEKTVALGECVETPIGQITVKPTSFYTQAELGEELIITKSSVTAAGNVISSNLGASKASKDASMIQLSFVDEASQRAEDILNSLMDAYKKDIVNDKNAVARNTERFVVERLAILEKELGNVDNQIASYRSENQLIDAAQSGMYLQQADQYLGEVVKLQTELELTRYLKEYLLQSKNAEALIPVSTGMSENSLLSQIEEYNQMRLQCDKLKTTSAEENPVVQDLQQALRSMRESILHSMDNYIESLQLQINSSLKQEARNSSKASSIPTHQKTVLSAERQQKVKEQLYVYLLQKREENALAEYIAESNARVIDRAKGSDIPIAPKNLMIYGVALTLGFGLPTALLFLLLLTDNKVHARKDLEDKISLPFLGDIPFCKKLIENQTLAVSPDGTDALTEAFRVLRTNLNFMYDANHPIKVLMNTSLNPGAGKTFVLSNLAAMITYTGKRVLLLDLDIRKGSLSRQFGGKRRIGITHYLAGRTDSVAELINHVECCPGLDIIYSGVVPPNPAELLMSSRLDQLMEELKKDYDYILVDNVPMAAVADAAITNRLADLTLFLGRSGVLENEQLLDIERFYREGKMKHMVFVLNGVKEEYAGYGRYGYSYGYGYGYGEKKKRKRFFGF